MAKRTASSTYCQHCREVVPSGLWLITTKKGRHKMMWLCAQCGMGRVLNRVVRIESPSGESAYCKLYKSVSLLYSITREDGPLSGDGLKPTTLDVVEPPPVSYEGWSGFLMRRRTPPQPPRIEFDWRNPREPANGRTV